jgi:hypothetical protein
MAENGPPVATPDAARCSAWTVVAGPFTRPEQLRGFIAAVAGIDGVTDLVAQRFRLGELSLSLRYHGAEPLADRLAALAGFCPRVTATSTVAIWLELGEGRQEG